MLMQYTYDSLNRVISEMRSGPDIMTEVTTYDYTPVDPSDPILPVDTRPRTVVRKLNNIECERTYYVYSPLTNISGIRVRPFCIHRFPAHIHCPTPRDKTQAHCPGA